MSFRQSLPRRVLVGRPPSSTLFPYTTLFRSAPGHRRRGNGSDRHRGRGTRRIVTRVTISGIGGRMGRAVLRLAADRDDLEVVGRSEEHTSELQSRENLVCRLLLEKKKKDVAH